MSLGKRSLAAGLITVSAVAGPTLMTAGPASAGRSPCPPPPPSFAAPSSPGPWVDNWDFTTSVCAKRSGAYVYAFAKVSWDGPVQPQLDNTGIFDSAHVQLQIKRSQWGNDPVK